MLDKPDNFYTRHQNTADLAQVIPDKVWETCLYSVSYRQTTTEPVSPMSLPGPFLRTFEINVCADQSFPINSNFNPTPLLQESGKIL